MATHDVALGTRIEVGIDYGTSATKIANRFRYPDGTCSQTQLVRPGGKTADIPAYIAVQDGMYRSGYDLYQRLNHKKEPRIHPENVIECLKLMLCDDFANSNTRAVKSIKAKLEAAGLTVDKAIELHLREIVAQIKAFLCRTRTVEFTPEAINATPVAARISVPQMWTPGARLCMQMAAEAAGIAVVEIASEPRCVLASYLDSTRFSQLPTRLDVQDHAIIADVGCGTADLVSYKLLEALSTNSKLQAVRSVYGGLCGSQQVNWEVQKNIIKSSSVEGVRKRLDMSREEWDFHLLSAIEGVKTKDIIGPLNNVLVRGTNGETWTEDVPRAMFEAAQDKPLSEAKSHLDALITDDPPRMKVIILAGGFCRSEFMNEELLKVYHKPEDNRYVVECIGEGNDTAMVALGALSDRYEAIAEQKLPSRFGFAFLQDEVANQADHPDCYNKSRKPIYSRVEASPKTLLAIDRLHVVMHQGQTQATEARQEYHPSV